MSQFLRAGFYSFKLGNAAKTEKVTHRENVVLGLIPRVALEGLGGHLQGEGQRQETDRNSFDRPNLPI